MHELALQRVDTRIYPTAKHAIIVQSVDIACFIAHCMRGIVNNEQVSDAIAYTRCEHMLA